MRREVYATTGPRMQVRVFGGWDFTDKDWAGDWVKAGYARGVPMGADLKDGKGRPSFLISALKDPEGANLDRVQVVGAERGAEGFIDTAGGERDGGICPIVNGSGVSWAAAAGRWCVRL